MVMKLATRTEGHVVNKAVWFKKQVDNHTEMMRTADYSRYGYRSYQECIENYHFYNHQFIIFIEEIAIDLKVPCENIIKMVNRMVRAS